jgi:hypothetical protein
MTTDDAGAAPGAPAPAKRAEPSPDDQIMAIWQGTPVPQVILTEVLHTILAGNAE